MNAETESELREWIKTTFNDDEELEEHFIERCVSVLRGDHSAVFLGPDVDNGKSIYFELMKQI